MSYWANVKGPSVSGAFGADSFMINSPDDVKVIDGLLVITAQYERGTPERTTTYPAGGWTSYTVGERVKQS